MSDITDLAEKLLDQSTEEEVVMDVGITPSGETEAAAPSASIRQRVKCRKFTEEVLSSKCLIHRGKEGCKLCTFKGTGDNLKHHIRTHFTKFFCKCGHSTSTKSNIGNHIHFARKAGIPEHEELICYEVDEASFPKFKETVQLKPTLEFGELAPSRQQSVPSTSNLLSAVITTTTTPTTAQTSSTSPVTVSSFASQDIRKNMSAQEIKSDARDILNKRKFKGGQKRSANPTGDKDSDMDRILAENTRLSKENSELRVELLSARRVLQKSSSTDAATSIVITGSSRLSSGLV